MAEGECPFQTAELRLAALSLFLLLWRLVLFGPLEFYYSFLTNNSPVKVLNSSTVPALHINLQITLVLLVLFFGLTRIQFMRPALIHNSHC